MNLKIRQYREAADLTQKEFAKLIGKSYGTVQSWERGDSFPNAEYVWKMCEFFGTDPNDFLGWWDEHERPSSNVESIEEGEILDRFRECTPEQRNALLLSAGNAALASSVSA